MTLCFFSAQYLPTSGGVERYTYNLALCAVRAGHRAIVVTSALPEYLTIETDSNGIEIFRLPVWPMMDGRFPVPKPGSRTFLLMQRLWEQKPDFCIIQTRMYIESIWAAREVKKRGIPALVIDHSTGYMPMGEGFRGWLGRRYEHAACALIARTGIPFYGVSAAVCRWLKTFHVTAAGTLYNAVNPDDLVGDPDSAQKWCERWDIGNRKLLLFVGRLIPEKGALLLARASVSLYGTVCAAVGEGPLRKTLHRHLAMTPGALEHDDVIGLMHRADVFCLPTSYSEGFPTTLLEAAACGCPVLCTRTAGTEELFPTDEYAYLLPGDPEYVNFIDVMNALKDMFAHPEQTAARAEAARRRVLQYFTWDVVFEKLMGTIEAELRKK